MKLLVSIAVNENNWSERGRILKILLVVADNEYQLRIEIVKFKTVAEQIRKRKYGFPLQYWYSQMIIKSPFRYSYVIHPRQTLRKEGHWVISSQFIELEKGHII